jgi:hypothetical protein
MKKSNRKELTWEQTEKLVTLALEENPWNAIEGIWTSGKRSSEIMKKDARWKIWDVEEKSSS